MSRKFYYVAITSCVVMILALALSTIWTAQSNAKPTAAALVIKPSHGKCSLCYSCGGKWPVFAGDFDVPSGIVHERGSECSTPSGFPEAATDHRPVLCCKQ